MGGGEGVATSSASRVKSAKDGRISGTEGADWESEDRVDSDELA